MKIKLLLIVSLFYLQLSAQNFPTDNRIALTIEPLDMVEKMTMPSLNNQALLDAEMARRAPGLAPKFAENIEVNITPETHGNWEDLANGNSVWRMKIESIGAKSLNLGFTKYFMPTNGTLVIYSPNYERVMGPFTPSDNEEHEQLWTPILEGDELVIEVQIPTAERANLELELAYVNHDYIGFSSMASGGCNLDVICGEADGWGIVDEYRDIIQSVAVISTGGDTFCTGFLVNNTNNDCAPLFMTAFHCGINNNNAASLVTIWNYFNSTCRQPGSQASENAGDGSNADFNTGAIFRADWAPSDFALVELDDPVSATADAFFAGWDATEIMTWDTVIAVHHPSTDEKRISFEFDPTFTGGYLADTPEPNGDHITVEDWDIGTTEGGSSGSPLFNADKRVIGQLHGGFASCSSQTLDSYGWFFTSWEGGGTPATRLKDWLDPSGIGIRTLDGRSQEQCNYHVEGTPQIVSFCASESVVFTINVNENFNSPVTLSVNDLPQGTTATFAENPIAPGTSTMLTIDNTNSLNTETYILEIAATDGTNVTDNFLAFKAVAAVPNPTTLNMPPLGASEVSTSPIFGWTAEPETTYEIQIATDSDFSDIVEEADGISGGTYQSSILNIETMYFWRVRGTNSCGQGNFPAAHFFTTANLDCITTASSDVPVIIDEFEPNTITSTLEVAQNGTIEDLNVNNLVIEHSYISDLSITLTSPSGTSILLVDLGSGGCEQADLDLNFDDDATNSNNDLVNMCEFSSPTASGTFQSADLLATFNEEAAQGTWTLTIEDGFGYDGGQLASWSLEICTIVPDDFSFIPSESTLTGCIEETVSFDIAIGGAFENDVNLSANNLPAGAMASFSQNPATPGSMVTVTLENVMVSGGFSIEILGDDGVNPTVSAGLIWNVNPAPAATSAVNPMDNAINQPVSLTMEWEAIAGANSYNYIIATDPDFADVVMTFTAINNSLLQANLEPNTTYYWMVTSVGDCGLTDSEVFEFTTDDLDSTHEVLGIELTLQPNPTRDFVNILLSTPLNESFAIEVYTINGQLLQMDRLNGQSTQHQIDLTNYASGIYLVKIVTGNTALVERIVLEK